MAALPLPPHLALSDAPFDDDDLDLWVEVGGAEGASSISDPRMAERLARIGNFVINDDGRAEWAGRKLADLTRRRNEVVERHEAWLEQIRESMDDELARLDPRIALFGGALAQYGILAREADNDRKSIMLPSVTIKTTKSTKPAVHVGNEDAVIAWADRTLDPEARDKVVQTKRKVLVTELRKVVGLMKGRGGDRVVSAANGETVPGVYVTPAGAVSASVSPK